MASSLSEHSAFLVVDQDRRTSSLWRGANGRCAFVFLALAVGVVAVIVMALSTVAFFQVKHNSPLAPCAYSPLTCKDQSKYSTDPHEFQRILVVFPHAIDAELAAGGTIARFVRSGSIVRYVMVTNSDKETSNRTMTAESLAEIRRAEQLAAAAALGVTSVDFLNVSDGYVVNDDELRANLTRLIRLYRPELVMTWSPLSHLQLYRHGLEQSDHQATGAAVLDSCFPRAREFLFYPDQLTDEGLEPWSVTETWLFSFVWDTPDDTQLAVDITGTIDAKVDALMLHQSQVSSSTPDSVRRRAEQLGSRHGIRYSEWFLRVLLPPVGDLSIDMFV